MLTSGACREKHRFEPRERYPLEQASRYLARQVVLSPRPQHHQEQEVIVNVGADEHWGTTLSQYRKPPSGKRTNREGESRLCQETFPKREQH